MVIDFDEINGNTFCAKPACPSHAMQISFWIFGEVIVDDKINFIDIYSSTEDISSHYQFRTVLLE